MKKIIFILLAIHASLFTPHVCEAQIIYVPADQPTIQAGINAASDGDTVLVEDDTYLENINFNGKAITVASNFIMDGDINHINNTIIDGSQPANPDYGSVVTFITGEDTTSVICGFTITGGTGMTEPTYGARIGGGIACYYASAKIIHNKIVGNEVNSPTDAWGGGIESFKEIGEYWTVIENNRITDNHCIAVNNFATGGGVEVYGDARICNNVIENNSCSCTSGIGLGGGVSMESINELPDTLNFFNNIVQNNTIEAYDWGEGGGVFSLYSITILSDNTIKYNTVTSPNSSLGGGVGSDHSDSFFTGNEISHNSVSGFTVQGGGVYFYLTENVEFINNDIYYNSCITDNAWYGAGVYSQGATGTTKFIRNEFSYNSGPVQPIGGGGGLWISDALETNVIVDCNMFMNDTAYNGGGFFEKSCYNVNLTNNIFSGNHASLAGGMAIYHPTINSGEKLPAERLSQPRIINNTFFSNSATSQGGAIRYQSDLGLNAPKILNCIFWENNAPQGKDVYNMTSTTLEISYSDIAGNNIFGPWSGEGNINADPLFFQGDPYYHLSSSSPCIDQGIFNMQTPVHDFDGEDRPDPVGGGMDIGADEFYDVPAAPVALDTVETGIDFFVALWMESLWAMGYRLDVAYDESFNDILPDYNDLDVGNDTSIMVKNLDPTVYYFRVRAYNALYTSPNSNKVMVMRVGIDKPLITMEELSVSIFPNPASGMMTFRYYLPCKSGVEVCIFDMQGNKIRTIINEEKFQGEYNVTYDLSCLPKGIYMVRLQAGHLSFAKKLIIM